jgi:PAS domain S-box-containing protein
MDDRFSSSHWSMGTWMPSGQLAFIPSVGGLILPPAVAGVGGSTTGLALAGFLCLLLLALAALILYRSWALRRQVEQRTEDLRRVTEANLTNERFMSHILEAMPLAVFGKAPGDQFRYVLFNHKAEELFSVTRAEVLGRNDYEVFPEARSDAYWETDLDLLNRAVMVEVPEQVEVPGQPVRHLLARKTVIRDSEQRPTLILGIVEDITGRVRMETELKRSREGLAKAQALAGIGNWEWHRPTGEVTWSDQMAQILGFAPGTAVPSLRGMLQRIHRDDRPVLGRSLRRLVSGRNAPPMDFRVVLGDGTVRFLHSILEGEPGPDGRPLRVRGTLQDVTERRTAEDAFRQAQKLESLGVLAGGIAHDFNNLLAAIGGNLELAQLNMHSAPDAEPFLVKIEKILKRASDLTRQMLAYSGKGRMVVRRLSLNQVAEEMPHLLEVSISKRVRLDYQFEPDLPPIEADPVQIQQVIMNLVTNASESIGDHDGVITLRTGGEYLANPQEQLESHGWLLHPGLFVTLEVADTGCGMSPETRRRLFDPFFTTKFSGRGLGLSAMLGILRGHNAGIRIRSREGEGSSFKLFFPASVTGSLPPEPEPPPRRAEVRGGNVLVVDDEPDILEATSELLQAMDFTVRGARDGLEAVDLVRDHPGRFTLVLMDLTMPRMDGREAAQLLQVLDPSLKIVLCSGFNEADVAGDLHASSSLSGFLQKPFTMKTLRETVEQALA